MLCISCILAPPRAFAQQEKVKCGTMEYLEKQKKADPSLEARMWQQEEKLQEVVARFKNPKPFTLEKGKPTPPPPSIQSITIPVVFHILENANISQRYISDQDVFDQIAITNRDYRGDNPNSMGSFPASLKANTQIQFCLAQRAPDGTPINGIHRVPTNVVDFPVDNSVKYTSSGGCDAWDPTRYFNIWVCDLQLYAGYAQFPTAGLNIAFGVVVDMDCFGYIDPVYIYRGGGACTTHEIGHCLNLRHIWGDDDGACNGTDYCDDTPNQANSTLIGNLMDGSGEITDACSSSSPGINYQNFMDYTPDRAQANFTPDQMLRMQACFAPGGPLEQLLSSDAGTPPPACAIPIGIQITGLTQTTASLTWMNMYNSGGYNIRYRKTTESQWTSTQSATNSITITGLTKKTNYEVQVENVCLSGGSGFSPSFTFKTAVNGPLKQGRFDETSSPAALTISPNPARGSAAVSYTLTDAGAVTITIVNVLGAEIVRLENGQMKEPGTYTIQYDAGRLIPGLYFVRLTTGRTMETVKFVIER